MDAWLTEANVQSLTATEFTPLSDDKIISPTFSCSGGIRWPPLRVLRAFLYSLIVGNDKPERSFFSVLMEVAQADTARLIANATNLHFISMSLNTSF
jgi:hypothetical protein